VVFEGSHFGIFLSALVPGLFFRPFYVVSNQTFTQYLSSELRRCSRVFFASFTLDVYSIFVANITCSLSEQSQQYRTSKSSSSNYYTEQDSFHSQLLYTLDVRWCPCKAYCRDSYEMFWSAVLEGTLNTAQSNPILVRFGEPSTSDGVLVRLIAETVMRCSGPLCWRGR